MACLEHLAVKMVMIVVVAVVVVSDRAGETNPSCSIHCPDRGVCTRGKDLDSPECDCTSLDSDGQPCETQTVNPCCSFPCQNRGVCMRGKDLDSYVCDCTNLDFYGQNCDKPYLLKRIKMAFKPSSDTVHNFLVSSSTRWLFAIINNIEWIHDIFIKLVYLSRANILDTPALYETVHPYTTIAAHTNNTFYARTLPPVPLECPTPMGVKGYQELPNVDVLVDKFFTRKEFRPDPMGSSLLFPFFAQHFTHMFFKTSYKEGPGYNWGGHGVDVTSIYGKNVGDENLLRSFKDGKLKLQVLNGEEYPMYHKDVPIKMLYPPSLPEESKFAMGHEFFGLLPGLFLYQTIWMREHNRVCDVLKGEHPDWDDEQLYQTGKLVILGETINIVIEDYVQHLASYNLEVRFRPTVLFDEPFQYRNKISVEFNHIYHWHPLMPDEFNINGTTYSMKEFMFHSELVVKHGTATFTDSLSRQRAGHMSHHNHGKDTIDIFRHTVLQGRQLRFQSLNNYRRRFNLAAYNSFEDLTGEKEMAKELEEFYGDIEAMELYVGVLVEKRRTEALFGETIVEIGGPFSVKGLLANPICSKQYWRPSTFGGEVGFNIVQSATLESLFCANIKGPCPRVSMRIPDFVEGDVDELNNFKK